AEQDIDNPSGDINYSLAASELAAAVAQLRTIRSIKKKLGK
ncbi:MAG TPA: F0F1 ATP synthase subunit epsilon, partial [Cellvibrionales bacterium]|nr:F0F1 ATP synthase subunit epsilon [Cellvibrionales bacterium]